MKVEKMRLIPIVDLLAHLGMEPVYRSAGGSQWMYHSPLRADNNASFSVSVRKNLWHDYGTDQGGNVIDLAIALNGGCSFHEASLWLVEQYRAFRGKGLVDIGEFDEGYNRETDIKVLPLTSYHLRQYMSSRAIPDEIAQRYCKEIHYWVQGRQYYSVCFPNILGGLEVRNRSFKGCQGAKGPSIIPLSKERRTDYCCVFEGFFDFLSYKTLEMKGDKEVTQPFPCDCIVLNSTSMVQKTYPFIDVYSKAFCYLDNDDAGWEALGKLEELMPGKVESCCGNYSGYNDVNDYLRKRARFL